ncbi:MAG TPA: DUF4375 domain-containing protein [Phycisphaerae bacterium]|nr:DUF4375 domain-containing protein [Phycisphaerae bacterium]
MKMIGIVVALCVVVVVVWQLSRQPGEGTARSLRGGRDFRIEAATAEMDDASLAWAVVEPIWTLAQGSDDDEKLPAEWAGVTEGQLAVYAVVWVEREVVNGGFWQYLYNSNADLPRKALDGFRKLGATEYAGLLEQAISLFPGGKLPKTRTERMRLMPEDPYVDVAEEHKAMVEGLDELDSRFFELYGEGDQFYLFIGDYIRANPEAFFK